MEKKLKHVLVAFLFLAANSFNFAQNSIKAVVLDAKGKAEVQDSQNVGKWISLKPGMELEKGALIQTGFKSELTLKIKGSKVTVQQLTRLTLEQLAENEKKDDIKLYLDTGSVKSNVKKLNDKPVGFKVRTPVATASVRGTVLEVKNGFRTTDVKTHEGVVAVWKSKNSKVEAAETEGETESLSDGAPADYFTVTKGQSAGFSNNGYVSTPENNARKNASSFTAATVDASATESEVSSTTTAVASGKTSDSNSKNAAISQKKTGKIKSDVKWGTPQK